MNRSCFVYDKTDRKTTKKLDENSQIPLAQPNRIRLINKRSAQGDDKSSITAGEFVKLNKSNQFFREIIRIRMSSDVASQLMCHGNSAAHNTSFSITKNAENNILRLYTEWKDWAKYDAKHISEEKRKMSIEIGRLAEQAISTRGDGTVSVQSGFPSSNGNCVRLFEREIDTVYVNGRREYQPAEVKCVGQLTMSKVMLFNTRLFPLVTKAIASQNGATFIVVRDDREMDLWNKAKTDSERMPILEIMFWENVTRLIPLSDFEKLKEFHSSLCCTLEEDYNNVKRIKNGAENIKFCEEEGKPKRMLSCKANIPKFSDKPEKGRKQMKQIVIVGPDIPYFEFRLSDLYMTYKHKHKRSWFMNRHYTKVVVIANTMEDLKNMFRTYNRHPYQHQLNITFITKEIFNKNDGLVVDKFMKDNPTYEQFTSFDDLGALLYKNNLTYWKKPIPACLLLLGKGQHIPKKMITSRLSFGILHEGTTGIDLSQCVEPELIAIIGTKEECKTGNKLIKEEFPNSTIHNFCLENKMKMLVNEGTRKSITYLPVKEDGLTFNTCHLQDLDAVMQKFNFPMYKNFKFNGKWVAE